MLETSATRRIDYCLIFYMSNIFVNFFQGNVDRLMNKMKNFFSDYYNVPIEHYAGTFKPFFEKKNTISDLFKVFGYTRLLCSVFRFHVQQYLKKHVDSWFDIVKPVIEDLHSRQRLKQTKNFELQNE